MGGKVIDGQIHVHDKAIFADREGKLVAVWQSNDRQTQKNGGPAVVIACCSRGHPGLRGFRWNSRPDRGTQQASTHHSTSARHLDSITAAKHNSERRRAICTRRTRDSPCVRWTNVFLVRLRKRFKLHTDIAPQRRTAEGGAGRHRAITLRGIANKKRDFQRQAWPSASQRLSDRHLAAVAPRAPEKER